MSEATTSEDAAAAPVLVVHIIDDDAAVRRSLALMLGSVGHATRTYAAAEDFLADIEAVEPGCAIIDIRMPGMDGLALQQELRRRGVLMPVVIVTGHGDVALAVQAMKAGAVDFIEKPYAEADMLRAVSAALEREADERQQRVASETATARIATLTPRERDVLRLLVAGWPNKVIAHELGISPRTVEIHRANLMDKLACRSLAQAVRMALAASFEP
jgi:two-component system response regulator FixJ